MSKIIKEVKLQNIEENHFKFWNSKLTDDGTMISEWGKIGTNGQSKTLYGVSEQEFDKTVNSKLKRGYRVAN